MELKEYFTRNMERLSNQLLRKTSRKTKDRDKKELNEEKIEFITEKKEWKRIVNVNYSVENIFQNGVWMSGKYRGNPAVFGRWNSQTTEK